MTLWTIAFFTAFMAICGDNGLFSARDHMSAAVQAKECGSTRMLDFGVLISGTVSDLVTVLLPLPMVGLFLGTLLAKANRQRSGRSTFVGRRKSLSQPSS